VYRHFEQPLLNLGLRMLGRQQDAEDAVQTAFMKFYRSIGRFQFESKLQTYLFRIMMNVCFDLLEKRKRLKLEALHPSVNSYSSGDDLRLQLDDAIRSLPERMQACFVMFAVQEMKQTEIAEVLEMQVGTVKAHIFQAKAKLRALLSDSRSEVQE
jgi:RNA polymerase sigma-70 factor (ECF subfamily)